MPVDYLRPDGSIAGDHAPLVDFDEVPANDWLAVNQFTVIEGQHNGGRTSWFSSTACRWQWLS
ncbi:MAG: hypothetical protein ABMA26_05640 [Limisphaerales bacterium]